MIIPININYVVIIKPSFTVIDIINQQFSAPLGAPHMASNGPLSMGFKRIKNLPWRWQVAGTALVLPLLGSDTGDSYVNNG